MRPSSPGYLRAPRVCAPPRPAGLALLALALLAGSGCSLVSAPYGAVTGPVGFFRDHAAYNDSSESMVLGWRNHVWSKKAWYQQRHLYASHPYVKDFGKGFQAGYTDVANGGDGCVPVLPPREYWSWRYQSPEGQGKSGAWFEGYPLGAAAAEKDGISDWSHIQTGYTADSKSIRGRANYVRIRDELLKKERDAQAEEVPPPDAGPDPARAMPREPDDLPPPRKTPPKPADPAASRPPKPQAGTLELLPPILPAQGAAGDEARILPSPNRGMHAMERLPAVQYEPAPIQQVAAEERARVPLRQPGEGIAARKPVAEGYGRYERPVPTGKQRGQEPIAESYGRDQDSHATGGGSVQNPFAARGSGQAKRGGQESLEQPHPRAPVAPSGTSLANRLSAKDRSPPARAEQQRSTRRSGAIYPTTEMEDPPQTSAWDAPEPPEPEWELEPERPAAPKNVAGPLPPMRGLRGRNELPEAPAPEVAPAARIARESQREEREARAALAGPIVERRSEAEEENLNDSP